MCPLDQVFAREDRKEETEGTKRQKEDRKKDIRKRKMETAGYVPKDTNRLSPLLSSYVSSYLFLRLPSVVPSFPTRALRSKGKKDTGKNSYSLETISAQFLEGRYGPRFPDIRILIRSELESRSRRFQPLSLTPNDHFLPLPTPFH